MSSSSLGTTTPRSGRPQVQRTIESQPNGNNIRDNKADTVSTMTKFFNPHRQFYLLKATFIMFCIVDIIHWAYLLRDDNEYDMNSWKFYMRIDPADTYYLIARMFGDIFVCVLGLGAAMWTRKAILTVPCILVQLLLLIYRAVVWPVRNFKGILREKLRDEPARTEDCVFIMCEFGLPFVWALLSILIVRTMRAQRQYEQLHGYSHPPVIVLTVKNDENDESVQIEIA